MNKKQKMILIAVIIVLTLMLLDPPHHPISGGRSEVYIGLLLTQWLGVGIIGAIAFFMSKDKEIKGTK